MRTIEQGEIGRGKDDTKERGEMKREKTMSDDERDNNTRNYEGKGQKK